jgi:sulfite reductase (NADPH) hemoprotein beta-component
MHAIQTSGNCVRNITTEAFAGVAADEMIDPRPLAEILRQWSTINPEFLFLPRKFKIAICSAEQDRAAIMMHDIGLYLYPGSDGQMLLRVIVGGGLGRTPILGLQIREGLPWQHLLSYVEAVLRVYNRHGRRDNKYKARIKILVKALGIEAFAREVEEEWQYLRDGPAQLTEDEYERVASAFVAPPYRELAGTSLDFGTHLSEHPAFARWVQRNVQAHKVPGYASVVLSTKPGIAAPPGDVTSEQMEAVAEWAERFGFGEIRIAHEQNIVLPDVPKADLFALWRLACEHNLGSANVGLLTDIIACPGGDFCALANAKSIPIAQAIQARFDDLDYLHDLGDISLNISGCMNACGHHHIGNIGILGVDKNGSEWYQITLGGAQGKNSALGKVIGPSFSAAEVPAVIEQIIDTFVRYRESEEVFVDTFQRIGLEPFKEAVYPKVLEVSA